jgi:hypothetical protein
MQRKENILLPVLTLLSCAFHVIRYVKLNLICHLVGILPLFFQSQLQQDKTFKGASLIFLLVFFFIWRFPSVKAALDFVERKVFI